MRTRLLPLPLLAATLLAVAGTRTPAPAATPSPCRPAEIPVNGRGLDGGVGCVDPHEQETPADLAAARAVFGGTRAGVDGADRLAALRQAQAMRRTAEAVRARTGATDYATASGTTVPDSGSPWVALGPMPLIVNDPAYPGGGGYGNDKVSGRVAAIVPDPTDTSGNTVYLGAAGGGVWKSTDAGDHWTSVGDPLPSQAVGALAVNKDGWVYAGLGEGNTGSDNYAGAGIVRSTDGGKTWSGLLGAGVIPEGVISTHIALAEDRILYGTNRGLFVSDDRGDTWKRALLPTGGPGVESTKAFGNFVTDVRIQPGSPDVALAAVGWRSGGIGAAAGLYKTTDGGTTWTKAGAATFGQSDLPAPSHDPIGRVSLAYAEGAGQDHNVVYALIQDPGKLNNEPFPVDIALPAQGNTNNLNGLYRSPDNGDTWVRVASNPDFMAAQGSGISTMGIPANGNYGAGVQAWYNNYVVVDPAPDTGTERVIVGLEEIYQGTAPAGTGLPMELKTIGRYWNACVQVVVAQLNCQQLGFPTYQGLTTHADQHAAAFALTPSGTRLYVGNDGGIYRQEDPAAVTGFDNSKWTSLNEGLNTTMPYAAAMGRDGTVFTGLQDNGTARIGADGVSNEAIGGDGFDVAIDPDDSDTAYEEYAAGVLRVTTNGGVGWSGDVSPAGKTGQRFSTPFELDPTDSAHFVYGGNQVWENTDAPSLTTANWTKVYDVTNAETSPDAAVTAIDVQGAATYAAWCGRPATPPAGSSSCNITTGDGDYDPSLMKRGIATNVQNGCKAEKASTDCWHQVQAIGLPNRFIQGIEIDPKDPKTVYVAMASFSRHWTFDPKATQPGVIFKSVDGGRTFQDITGTLPQTFGGDVLVVGDRLIAATDVGVFAAPLSSPTSWVPFGTGLPEAVPAIEVSTNPQHTKLVLATHGRGVWSLSLTGKNNGGTGGTGGGGHEGNGGGPRTGPIATTGLPGWVPLLALPFLALAVLTRRRLRAARG
jgi:hypothetical protein